MITFLGKIYFTISLIKRVYNSRTIFTHNFIKIGEIRGREKGDRPQ
ncbi:MULTISPECIES: hypothetical protein [unclassified Methanosarcina]|nr:MULTISPECIES: hypothetical protein [unclassified Methanosarcina]